MLGLRERLKRFRYPDNLIDIKEKIFKGWLEPDSDVGAYDGSAGRGGSGEKLGPRPKMGVKFL
jgi:hypothetical protein